MITFINDLENKKPKVSPPPKKNLQAVCQYLSNQVSFWVKSCTYILKEKNSRDNFDATNIFEKKRLKA